MNEHLQNQHGFSPRSGAETVGADTFGGGGGQNSGRGTRDKKLEEEEAIESGDDDSFLDWETRSDCTPMSSHIIAGK